MPVVTVSSKHQITLPAEIVRAMDLKPGDKLIANALDWRIVIMKESENRLERYIGSLKGVYGSTKEEIDRYIAEVRYGWDIDALKDALAGDATLRAVYGAIPSSDVGIRLDEIGRKTGIKALGDLLRYLGRLQELNAIKQIPLEFDPEKLQGNQIYRRIP
ncbi:MAG: AbrB/MazE/SpoVT family DNA-binding domain-containing protein [Chloroflexi bacterium]|nr:AbrB/MazE/SpoVT family DNA-binding domain-containing protein [Chloroflexota bacterium]